MFGSVQTTCCVLVGVFLFSRSVGDFLHRSVLEKYTCKDARRGLGSLSYAFLHFHRWFCKALASLWNCAFYSSFLEPIIKISTSYVVLCKLTLYDVLSCAVSASYILCYLHINEIKWATIDMSQPQPRTHTSFGFWESNFIDFSFRAFFVLLTFVFRLPIDSIDGLTCSFQQNSALLLSFSFSFNNINYTFFHCFAEIRKYFFHNHIFSAF